MSTKKYKNPPLTEAVFEVFYESSNWSPATPGDFFSQVKDKYPIISQAAGGFGVRFDAKGIQLGQGNNDLTQYKSKDNQSIIQLSPNLFTVNKLPQYSGWEFYKEMIQEGINSLTRTLEITKISRVGLRIINKLDIGEHTYENFQKVFKVYPVIPGEGVNGITNSIQLNYETQVSDDPREVLAINLATLRKEKGYQAPAQFQLYFTRLMEIEVNEIENWLELAHANLHQTFETTLTEETKNNFDND